MRAIWAVPVIASILILGVIGLSAEVYAPPAPKVVICHIPPGNPENAQTIEVSEYAVDSHLAHGDSLGDCGAPPGPTCDPPEDPFDGNLRLFVNEDGMGFCGIQCEVWSGLNGCPFRSTGIEPFDQGTTDQLGNLSFNIPDEELDDVTVVCDLSEVGGVAGWWYFVDVPMTSIPNDPFDFNIDDGTNMCCPTL